MAKDAFSSQIKRFYRTMKKKILVIDNEIDLCHLLERVLNKKGYDVNTTTNPFNAIDLLKQENYSLLLVDLRIPEMDGIEFIKRARGAGYSNKCFLISVSPTAEAIQEAKKLGISDFFTKPLIIQELEDAVSLAVNPSPNQA